MFKKIIISACVTLALAGCAPTQRADITPELDFIFIKDNINGFDNYCEYMIHKPTNVVYLLYGTYGITVMLNPDGTPVTADQLGIDIEK